MGRHSAVLYAKCVIVKEGGGALHHAIVAAYESLGRVVQSYGWGEVVVMDAGEEECSPHFSDPPKDYQP